jgi:hypothetical protein
MELDRKQAMSILPSHITSLTADYEAIEQAIRETSRGRWFLNCYLERNRSAETKILLNAIGRLEAAMRDNGQVLQDTHPLDTLMSVREAIFQARDDMAHLPRVTNGTTELPLSRFDFEGVPSAISEEVGNIRDAVASIQSAAYALQAAGVFQGVARQVAERADSIEHACAAQEAVLARASRMAMLLSEIEAELMSTLDDDQVFAPVFEDEGCDIRSFRSADRGERAISDELVEEISAALYDNANKRDSADPSSV